jgi:hypothetical protein
MQDHEKETAEKFTIADAFSVAQEWVFNTTRLGWLTIIGIILVVVKVIGSLDTAWINVLWPFILVAGTISITALVFYMKYNFKVVIETEVEAKEYKERLFAGKTWHNSGVQGVILQVKWVKKK